MILPIFIIKIAENLYNRHLEPLYLHFRVLSKTSEKAENLDFRPEREK